MRTLQNKLVRGLQLELKYFEIKFSVLNFFIVIISIIEYFVISIGDVQGFLLGDNSLIPKDWIFFKNQTNVKAISVIFVITIYLCIRLINGVQRAKEISESASVVKDYTIPWTENKLNNLVYRSLKQKYGLSDDIRASIFLPIRVGFFQWRLQMICRTKNIQDKELDTSFRFNEGVLGYTFMRVRKCHVEFVDVSERDNFPSTYVHLSQDNRNLIEPDIKAVTVLAFSQGNSIIGLLAIDTTNTLDSQILQNPELHSEALNWMHLRKKEIELLWRMMNNV